MAAVLAASRWATNADLIADCHRLGYLQPGDLVLDPTHGRGVWWKNWQPDRLVTLDAATPAQLAGDFRHLPFAAATFDAVAYDPPYVSVGGRKTTGIPDFHNRFGLTTAPRSPRELQYLINVGLTETHRVVRPRGIVLVKCQDYVSSGKLWLGTHHTLTHALALKFSVLDRLEHIGDPRPQPGGRRQVHARRNLSTLFVLQAGA